MGRKIFISYKYADSNVLALTGIKETTVRNYVDIIQSKIDKTDHINKGEDDGEDMSSLADSTIASKLGDKIFDSSVTIVLISKGMKENIPENDQWIPWEVSYSLKNQSREGGNSKTNAVLAVVLPEKDGTYNHFIKDNTCTKCNCRTLQTNNVFQILRDNMFNIKNPIYTDCDNHIGNKPYKGYSSFIYSVKWETFIQEINKYIDIAVDIRSKIEEYEIARTIKA